jgi:hypothetical protein
MRGTITPPKPDAGLMVYLTRAQRQQLREVLAGEGIYSASGWLRQIVVQKLREAAEKDDHHDAA